MKLYHGSNIKVQEPEIRQSGFYKDFGYGFYCTNIEKQARKWALTKRPKHIVSVYEYRINEKLIVFCTEKALKALTFERSFEL